MAHYLQGSNEEKRDVLEAYEKHKGKMSAIVDSIMLGTIADEERFRAVIDAAIESKEVASLPAFRKGAKTSASKKSTAKRKAKIDKVMTFQQLYVLMVWNVLRLANHSAAGFLAR